MNKLKKKKKQQERKTKTLHTDIFLCPNCHLKNKTDDNFMILVVTEWHQLHLTV